MHSLTAVCKLSVHHCLHFSVEADHVVLCQYFKFKMLKQLAWNLQLTIQYDIINFTCTQTLIGSHTEPNRKLTEKYIKFKK